MSDPRLREAERRWLESSPVVDEAAYLTEQMRAGQPGRGLERRQCRPRVVRRVPASELLESFAPLEEPVAPRFSELDGVGSPFSERDPGSFVAEEGCEHDPLV